jgi:hypothetical protein
MPTTTNFGWTTPADTDLVKDGAAAIRTFAGNVDTSLVDLKGGTTGQYLQKNSGTDLDYVWADVSAGGMTLISTTTLTGASITLSSIPQTYNHLQLVIQNYKPAVDQGQLAMRFNADSAVDRHASVAAITGSGAFNATRVLISAGDQDNSVATGLTITNIYNYTNTATWKFCNSFSIGVDRTTTTNYRFVTVNGGLYNQTTAISSLELFDIGGNLTSGTVLLYGVK